MHKVGSTRCVHFLRLYPIACMNGFLTFQLNPNKRGLLSCKEKKKKSDRGSFGRSRLSTFTSQGTIYVGMKPYQAPMNKWA